MNKHTKEIIGTIGMKAQYDENAKKLLSNKIFLAHILKGTVTEFKDANPRDIISLIEGEPYVSTVSVEPGMTNQVLENPKSKIKGSNTENMETKEGAIRFDIIFYVRMKDGISQIIVNIEAQKNSSPGYPLMNRAIFYTCRMISSQKERDFSNSNYNDIKRVYSIWVCMNMPENSLEHIHLVKDSIVNSHEWKGKMNLVNIVMIGLAEELPEYEEKYELHRLLGALLSQDLTVNEKLNIIGNEYAIPMEKDFREDVGIMCNLSQKIKETGIEMGKREMIMKMYNKGYTAAQIADVAEMDEKQIKEIIKNAELLPV